MSESKVSIAASALPDLLPLLMKFCTVTGSTYADDGMVSLRIKGDAVPFADAVTCHIRRSVEGNAVTLTATFEAAAIRNPMEGRG